MKSSVADHEDAGTPLEGVLADLAEFEGLHRTESARILRLCRMLLDDPDEAEDVRQEVFLKLYVAQRRLPEHPNWSAWLTRVAVNACHDRRRTGWWKLWRGSDDAADAALISPEISPEQMAVRRETRERIWGAFGGLSPRQREVFVLRHVEGWSTDEVGRALGMTSGSVKRYLFRAVRQLRRGLRRSS